MKTAFAIFIIYILSCIGSYKWISAAYSKDGVKSDYLPTKIDVFLTFCPCANTVIATLGWTFFSPYKDNRDKSKFFNTKN